MAGAQWRGSTRRERLPANWRPEIRPEVFETYGTQCHKCGHPDVSDVDHLEPGDNHEITNLRPICGAECEHCAAEQRTPCHVVKSSREGGIAAQAARPKRQRQPEAHPGLR